MTTITRSITALVLPIVTEIQHADHAIFSLRTSPFTHKTIVGFLQSWEVTSAFRNLDLLVKTGCLSPHIEKVVECLLRHPRLCYTGTCLGLVLDVSASSSVINEKMRKVIRRILQGIGAASHIVSLTCAVFFIAHGKRALGIASASILFVGLIDRCTLLSPKASFRFKNSLEFIGVGATLLIGSSAEKILAAMSLIVLGKKLYPPVIKLAKAREELGPIPDWSKVHQLANFHIDEFFKQGGIPTHCFTPNFAHLNYILPPRGGEEADLLVRILFALQDYRIERAEAFLSEQQVRFPSLSLKDFYGFGLQKDAAEAQNEDVALSTDKQFGISAFEAHFLKVYNSEQLIAVLNTRLPHFDAQWILFWANSQKLGNARVEILRNHFVELSNNEKIKMILFDMGIIKDPSVTITN